MNRRTFLMAAAGSAVVGLGGGAAWLQLSSASDALTTDHALELLARLEGRPLQTNGPWSPSEVFQHCAQSVIYSMQGYPEPKAAWFKSSVGPLAFSVFRANGAMRHDTAEAIPGAASLNAQQAEAEALQGLKKTLLDFSQYDGALKDHFAYGALSKRDYEIAHTLHLIDHLQDFSPS